MTRTNPSGGSWLLWLRVWPTTSTFCTTFMYTQTQTPATPEQANIQRSSQHRVAVLCTEYMSGGVDGDEYGVVVACSLCTLCTIHHPPRARAPLV